MIAVVRALREGRITRRTLPSDLLAGLVVGIVAVPLSMAIAIAAGLRPEQGLVAGVLCGGLVALFGGTQVQIAGPTNSFVVLLAVAQEHGTAGLLLASLMAGVILVMMGIAKLGHVIRYIPHPVTLGFTVGMGVVILTSQIPDFFGLAAGGPPRNFFERIHGIARGLPTLSWHATVVALCTLAVIVLFPRVSKKVPSPLVGMIAGTLLSLALGWSAEQAGVAVGDAVATIGSRFGGIPSAFPTPRLPSLDWDVLSALVVPATSIAVLCALESLLSATAADAMTGETHDSNQELIGQGIANVVAGLFGGMTGTGAIARTATNVRYGGRSPVAGLTHAFVLLFTMLVLAPYARYIPLASLAAILFVVAWNLRETSAVLGVLRSRSMSDKVVFLTTFGLTVLVNLTVAVEVGVLLAAVLFMKHMADRVEMKVVHAAEHAPDPHQGLATSLPPEIATYSIDGPFFFAVAKRFGTTLAAVDSKVRIVILRLWRVPYLDASGENALRQAVASLRRSGRRVILSGVNPEVRAAIAQSGLLAEIGEGKVWGTLEEALALARDLLFEIQAASNSATPGRGAAHGPS